MATEAVKRRAASHAGEDEIFQSFGKSKSVGSLEPMVAKASVRSSDVRERVERAMQQIEDAPHMEFEPLLERQWDGMLSSVVDGLLEAAREGTDDHAFVTIRKLDGDTTEYRDATGTHQASVKSFMLDAAQLSRTDMSLGRLVDNMLSPVLTKEALGLVGKSAEIYTTAGLFERVATDTGLFPVIFVDDTLDYDAESDKWRLKYAIAWFYTPDLDGEDD